MPSQNRQWTIGTSPIHLVQDPAEIGPRVISNEGSKPVWLTYEPHAEPEFGHGRLDPGEARIISPTAPLYGFTTSGQTEVKVFPQFVAHREKLSRWYSAVRRNHTAGGLDVVVAGDSIFEGVRVTTLPHRMSNRLAERLRQRYDRKAAFQYGEVVQPALLGEYGWSAGNADGGIKGAGPFSWFSGPGHWKPLIDAYSGFPGHYAYTDAQGAVMRWEFPAPCNLTAIEFAYQKNYNYGKGTLDVFQGASGFKPVGTGSRLTKTIDQFAKKVVFNNRELIDRIDPRKSLVVQYALAEKQISAEGLFCYSDNFDRGIKVSNVAVSGSDTHDWGSTKLLGPLEWGGSTLSDVVDDDHSTGGARRCKLWIFNCITNDAGALENYSSQIVGNTEFVDNLHRIFDTVSNFASQPAILYVIPPLSGRHPKFDMPKVYKQMREFIYKAADQNPHVAVMDVWAATGDSGYSTGVPEKLGWTVSDRVHYSDKFNDFLSSAIFEVLVSEPR